MDDERDAMDDVTKKKNEKEIRRSEKKKAKRKGRSAKRKWQHLVVVIGEFVYDMTMQVKCEVMRMQAKWRNRGESGRSLTFEEVEARSEVIWEMIRYKYHSEEYNVVDDSQFLGLNDESRRIEDCTETILFREGGFEPD